MGHELNVEVQFDAGHRVPNHRSKCRNPHGHRYRVVAHLTGELVTTPGASDEGMLSDFSDVKEALKEVAHDKFDHGFVVYVSDNEFLDLITDDRGMTTVDWKIILVHWIPTAENFAKYIFVELSERMESDRFYLKRVDVWETPTSCASYVAD